ncbi:MAG: DUF4270 family protein [Bacteroidota bacterium]
MTYIFSLKGIGKTFSKILITTGIFSLFFISCEEDPTPLGRDILPSTDDINTKYTDTIPIETNVIEGLPRLTSTRSRLILGSLNDPNFGSSKADFMTKFAVADTAVPEMIEFDSLILRFNVQGYYGDSLSQQTLKVYELTDTLKSDEMYYSDKRPDGMYHPVEIAQGEISPRDSLIRVKIDDPDFLQRFEEVHDSVYADASDFYDFFQGFYITIEEEVEKGAFLYLDLSSTETYMSLYYQENDTSEAEAIELFIVPSTPRVNSFYHDYESSRVFEYLGSDSPRDTALFIAGMGGVNTRISFPGIEAWLDKQPVAINSAELYIPVEDSIYNDLSEEEYPSMLHLLTFEDDNRTFLYDYRMDDSNNKNYFGGGFNSVEDAFIFNIGAHLQSYIEGDVDHLDLILEANVPYHLISLMPSNAQASIDANRVILKGPGARNQKMRLKITYTEF